jgi:hypothetical protein
MNGRIQVQCVLVHDDDQWALIGLNHCTSVDNGDAGHLVTINANDINKAAGAGR